MDLCLGLGFVQKHKNSGSHTVVLIILLWIEAMVGLITSVQQEIIEHMWTDEEIFCLIRATIHSHRRATSDQSSRAL